MDAHITEAALHRADRIISDHWSAFLPGAAAVRGNLRDAIAKEVEARLRAEQQDRQVRLYQAEATMLRLLAEDLYRDLRIAHRELNGPEFEEISPDIFGYAQDILNNQRAGMEFLERLEKMEAALTFDIGAATQRR